MNYYQKIYNLLTEGSLGARRLNRMATLAHKKANKGQVVAPSLKQTFTTKGKGNVRQQHKEIMKGRGSLWSSYNKRGYEKQRAEYIKAPSKHWSRQANPNG